VYTPGWRTFPATSTTIVPGDAVADGERDEVPGGGVIPSGLNPATIQQTIQSLLSGGLGGLIGAGG
jgi:hypothetical protein